MQDADLAELIDRVTDAAREWAERRCRRLAGEYQGAGLLLLAELLDRHGTNRRAVRSGLTRRLPAALRAVERADERSRMRAWTGGQTVAWVAA